MKKSTLLWENPPFSHTEASARPLRRTGGRRVYLASPSRGKWRVAPKWVSRIPALFLIPPRARSSSNRGSAGAERIFACLVLKRPAEAIGVTPLIPPIFPFPHTLMLVPHTEFAPRVHGAGRKRVYLSYFSPSHRAPTKSSARYCSTTSFPTSVIALCGQRLIQR